MGKRRPAEQSARMTGLVKKAINAVSQRKDYYIFGGGKVQGIAGPKEKTKRLQIKSKTNFLL